MLDWPTSVARVAIPAAMGRRQEIRKEWQRHRCEVLGVAALALG